MLFLSPESPPTCNNNYVARTAVCDLKICVSIVLMTWHMSQLTRFKWLSQINQSTPTRPPQSSALFACLYTHAGQGRQEIILFDHPHAVQPVRAGPILSAACQTRSRHSKTNNVIVSFKLRTNVSLRLMSLTASSFSGLANPEDARRDIKSVYSSLNVSYILLNVAVAV